MLREKQALNRRKAFTMKIASLMLCIAISVGCSENENPYPIEIVMPQPQNGDFTEWWEIVCIIGDTLEPSGTVKLNDRIVFGHAGSFIHDVELYQRKSYVSPPKTSEILISYTTRGRYTTQGDLLTITNQNTQMNVDVSLEELESAKVAEIKKGLQQKRLLLFKDQYTWQIVNNLLILSSPQRTIVLVPMALLDELELD